MRYILALFTLSVMLTASDSGPVRWSAESLKRIDQNLASKLNEKKLAAEKLGQFDNHMVALVRREGSGDAEQHVRTADIFYVVSGKATVQVGGNMVSGRHTSGNELLGTSINGGTKTRLGPGDVFHIPANAPHQVLVQPGKQFVYVMVKIDEP
jgi:quercetin dioxygenase-like cupin family protein